MFGSLQFASAEEPSPNKHARFDLRDGDRVVLLGGTFIEREQKDQYIETMLTAAFPSRNVTFRNLGWSGDVATAHARRGFGTTADGFQQLTEHLGDLKPTVVFLAYGANESHAGEKGLPEFLKQLDALLKMIDGHKPRIVFLGPLKHEDLGWPLPDPTENNKNRRLYADAIKKIADRRGERFIDLYRLLGDAEKEKCAEPLTDNGIHLTQHGYWRAALAIQKALGIESAWELRIDGPDDQLEKLRATIREKNELYFHRWRPQNNTYLFLFRKHEQGNNAAEIPRFDPLVAEKEREIAKLRVPR